VALKLRAQSSEPRPVLVVCFDWFVGNEKTATCSNIETRRQDRTSLGRALSLRTQLVHSVLATSLFSR
jgi:hypothetical protein